MIPRPSINQLREVKPFTLPLGAVTACALADMKQPLSR
jgi:hypothetical protein